MLLYVLMHLFPYYFVRLKGLVWVEERSWEIIGVSCVNMLPMAVMCSLGGGDFFIGFPLGKDWSIFIARGVLTLLTLFKLPNERLLKIRYCDFSVLPAIRFYWFYSYCGLKLHIGWMWILCTVVFSYFTPSSLLIFLVDLKNCVTNQPVIYAASQPPPVPLLLKWSM